MVIVPNSKIILLKSPLKLDNYNQITFSNATAQYNYFYSLPKLELNNATYQRKDGVIYFPTHTKENDGLPTFEDLLQYNYCMYQNTSYNNKWFYAFVTDIEYDNNGMSVITIETDVFQSWQFDIIYKNSFIEREHVSNDSVGANTIPEGLELGPYISCKLQPTDYFNKTSSDCCFVVAVSELANGLAYSQWNSVIPIGLYYIGCTTQQGVWDLIHMYDDLSKGDAINSVFIAPKDFFSSWTNIVYQGSNLNGQFSLTLTYENDTTIDVTQVNYLGNDYTPRNNKLLTYPYTFLQVSNNSGAVVNYKWENFNLLTAASINKIQFKIIGTITPGCSYRAYPINYNNILNDFDDGITFGKLPIGSWTSDVYTNWLTQNALNIELNNMEAVSGTIKSAVSGNPDFTGGFMSIARNFEQIYEHSLIPDQVRGNVNCGDVNYQYNLTALYFKRMSIKNEYASIIDSYFDAYGYKVNRLATPNIHKRSNWDYMKCMDVNLEGNIPEKDLEKLRSLFNGGCTFWHTTTYYLDYSRTNSIL